MNMKKVYYLIFLIQSVQLFAQIEKSSQIYGFFQPVYRINLSSSTNPDNEFYINRFRLGLETKIYKSLKSEIELDPLEPMLIKDADFRWKFLKSFELTVGKFKKPFSLERLTSVREIPFLERTKIVKELDNLSYAGRDLGIQISLAENFGNIGFKFSTGVFNGNPDVVTGDNNSQKSFVQRMEISSGRKFFFAINSSQKFDTLAKKFFTANGLDFILNPIDQIKITSEFLVGKKDSNTSIGGFYSLIEYQRSNITLGFRYSKYFSDIKRSGINFFETKIDWKIEEIIRIHINLVNEQRSSKFENNLFFGISYVH